MTLLRLLPRFRRADAELVTLAMRERWSRTDVDAYQLERLNHLWHNAISTVPYYQQLHRQLRLPDRFGSLAEFSGAVPVLEKQDVAKRVDELRSSQATAGAWHRTSGSTGVPTRVFRSHADHQRMLCAKYRFYASCGLDVFDRVAWLWSDIGATVAGPKTFLARWRSATEDRLRNRLRLPAARLGADDLRRYLAQMQAFRPMGIYGFSRAVAVLAQQALVDRVTFHSLRCVIMTGEAASVGMRKTVERAFRARTAMEYGSVECGFIAGETLDGELRVRDDHVLLDTLPRSDGHFDIIVTCLNNAAFPLLRYRIGDVTMSPIERPDRGFSVLHDVAGRNDDMLTAASGRLVHAACVDEVFEANHDAQVSRYVIHQARDGSVLAKVVPSAFTSPSASIQIRVSVEDALKTLLEGVSVRCELVDQIQQTAVGKHRLITSEFRPAARDHELTVGAELCVS